MFVLELRGYEQTPDGDRLVIPPIGRISMHEDRDDDGIFEHHTVFVDKLVFPRFVMPFGADAILTMETNADEVWKYTDTNNDGVADKKELFTTGFGRAGNMESQPPSLFWAMDNWLYSTVNAFRLRWTPTALLKEPTGPNGVAVGRHARTTTARSGSSTAPAVCPAISSFPSTTATSRRPISSSRT